MTDSPRNAQRAAAWGPPTTPASPAPAPTTVAAARLRPTPSARTLPARADQRPAQRPGHASKIIAAGLSASAVLGVVSYLGTSAQAAKQAVVPAVQAASPAATPAVTASPQVIVVGVPGVPTPIAAAPQPTAAPQAAPAPVVTTSGTTKASG